MKKKATNSNGRDGWEERDRRWEQRMDALAQAQATLTQAQAAMVQTQNGFNQTQAALMAQISEQGKETAARFARLEDTMSKVLRVLDQHSLILNEHTRILERLPEEVREKIGFKSPPS